MSCRGKLFVQTGILHGLEFCEHMMALEKEREGEDENERERERGLYCGCSQQPR